MARVMQKVKCRDLLDLAIKNDQNNINFGHMYRLFSLLIAEANVGNVTIDIPKLIKEQGDQIIERGISANLTKQISNVEIAVNQALENIPTAEDLIFDSYDASMVEDPGDHKKENQGGQKRRLSRMNTEEDLEMMKTYENKVLKRNESRVGSSISSRRPSTVIADNFKIGQLARQVGSVENDLSKVYEILDKLSLQTNEATKRLDDLDCNENSTFDSSLVNGKMNEINEKMDELKSELKSELVSWTDLNKIAKIENDEEDFSGGHHGHWKRQKLSDSEEDEELKVKAHEFVNLTDHHINHMNLSNDINKSVKNIEANLVEMGEQMESISSKTDLQILSIRRELEIETECNCPCAEKNGFCATPDICELKESENSESRRKSISTKNAMKMSLEKMALISNHEGEIKNIKTFQKKCIEEIDELKIEANAANKMINILREKQRSSTKINEKSQHEVGSGAMENMQETIVKSEAKMDRLSKILTDLLEGDVMKGESLKKMEFILGDLSEKSASVSYVEEILQNKANLEDVQTKVNKEEFDQETTILSETITDLLERINEQDRKLADRIEKMNQNVSGKIGKDELEPFQIMIETRIKTIRKILDQQAKHIVDSKKQKSKDAAGAKKQALSCISCDSPAKQGIIPYFKQIGEGGHEGPPGKLFASLPEGRCLPAIKSIRPYTSFELDSLRTTNHKSLPGISCNQAYKFAIEEKNVHRELVRLEHQNQKQMNGLFSAARACGGGHTTIQYTKLDKNPIPPKTGPFVEWSSKNKSNPV